MTPSDNTKNHSEAQAKHDVTRFEGEVKQRLETKAAILKSLAHPTRLWIVEQLLDGERCVCELVDAVDADFSTISKHLSLLKATGIIANDKRGKKVFYSLKIPCVLNFFDCVNAVIESKKKD